MKRINMILTVAIFLFESLSPFAFANQKNKKDSPSCRQFLQDKKPIEQENLEINNTQISSPKERRVLKSFAQWIKKNLQPPSLSQLSVSSNVSVEEIVDMMNTHLNPTSDFSHHQSFDDNFVYWSYRQLLPLVKEHFPEVIDHIEKKLIKTWMRLLKENLKYSSLQDLAEYLKTDVEWIKILFGPEEQIIIKANQHDLQSLLKFKNKIITAFTRLAKKRERPPTMSEMSQLLGTREKDFSSLIGENKIFLSFSEIQNQAIAKDRASLTNNFRFFMDTDFFSDSYLKNQLDALKNKNTIILTSAQAGVPMSEEVFSSLLQLQKEKDAALFIFPLNMELVGLDQRLFENPNTFIVTQSILVSPEFEIVAAKLSPKMNNPLISQNQGKGHHGHIRVFGHSQAIIQSVPSVDNSFQNKKLITTGSITAPDYRGFKHRPDRTSQIAAENHWTGVLLAEKSYGSDNLLMLPTKGFFHFRHVEFVKGKGFLDLKKLYSPRGTFSNQPIEAIVTGDVHVGESDNEALLALKNLIRDMKPKYIVLHDLFNGHSVSHYDREKVVTLARKQESGQLNLVAELNAVKIFLESLLKLDPSGKMKVIVPPANHNFWLSRYLNSPQWLKEPQNALLASELFSIAVKGEDPLEIVLLHGTESAFTQPIAYPLKERVIFLQPGQSFKIPENVPSSQQVEVGKHGHERINGARGNIKSFVKAVHSGRIVFGHTHIHQKINGAVNIGTLSQLDLEYAKDGISGWAQAVGLVGANGEIQDLQFNSGEFFAHTQLEQSEDFFIAGYPRLLVNGLDN